METEEKADSGQRTAESGKLHLTYTPPAKRVDDRRCFACGCTEWNACLAIGGACHWVAWDLCSSCLFDFAIQCLARNKRIGAMLGALPQSALAKYLMREIGAIESNIERRAA